MSVPATTDVGGRPLDPRLLLRLVTCALALVAALWHLNGAAALQPASAVRVLTALALGLALLAWSGWLLLRPSRRCLVAGALAVGAMLGLVGVLLVRAEPGTVGPASLVGLVLQVCLLGLVLVGLAPRVPVLLVRASTRSGAVLAALALCLVVAGGAQGHHRSGADAPAPDAARTAFVCSLL